MKNILVFCLILIVFTVLSGLAAPYFVGKMAHDNYTKLVQHVSKLPGITAEVVDYQGGYMSATATTKLIFHRKFKVNPSVTMTIPFSEKAKNSSEQSESSSDNGDIEIILTHDFRHGPFLKVGKGDEKKWQLAQALVHTKMSDKTKALYELEKIKNFLTIDAFFDIHGYIDVKVMNKPYTFTRDDGFKLEWGGGSMRIVADNTLTRINGVIATSKLRLINPSTRTFLILSGHQSNFKYNKTNGIYWVGQHDLKLKEFKLATPDWKTSIDELTYSDDTTATGGKANSIISVGAKEIQSYGVGPALGYGQQFRLFKLKLGTYNIADSYMKKYDEVLNSLNALDKAGTLDKNDQVESLTFDDIKLFLSESPKMVIEKLEFFIPSGKFSGSASVQLADNAIKGWEEMPKLLETSTAEIKFKVGLDALIDLASMKYREFSEKKTKVQQGLQINIDALVQEGFLEAKDGVIELDFLYRNGKTFFHGVEKNPSMLPNMLASSFEEPPQPPTPIEPSSDLDYEE